MRTRLFCCSCCSSPRCSACPAARSPRRARTSIATTRSAASPSRRTPRGAARSEIGDLYEMTYNLFVQPGYKPSGLRAQNLNTIDEVPDSSWFTNRIGAQDAHDRRDRPRSDRRRAAGSVALDHHPGEDLPAFIPA